MGFIRSFFQILWRGLDGLRKFLHLLVLLVIFGLLAGVLRTSIPHLPAEAALVIRPQGELVEQLSGDPVNRALDQAQGQGHAETLLRDVTEAIRAARTDKRIKAIVLELDQFAGGGQPELEEVVRALAEFRESGKKVVAYGIQFEQPAYYLASAADEIYLDPLGFVLIDGYDRYRMFYKTALDRLGVEVDVFRVGNFKSAEEPYTRTDMSKDDREESLAYLGVLWSGYQKAVTEQRRLAEGSVANYVATAPKKVPAAGGDAASVALEAGLVTALKNRLEVEDRLIELVGEDEDNDTFNAVSLEDYVRVLHAGKRLRADGTAKIGVIVASGEILDGEQPPGTIGGDSLSQLIREARLDDDVKAVVLRVDSPGGSVSASEEIYQEIRALQEDGKPVVVSMGDVAASGGYYIAAPADEIWASPTTITGSIGIFAALPNVSRTLGKLGVTVDGVSTTPLAGALSIDRPLGPEVRALIQSSVNHGYEAFLARVAAGRDKTRDEVDTVAQGRVWAGVDAERVGLVDHLGGFEDAVKSAAKLAKLTSYDLDYIEPNLSFAQQLAVRLGSRAARLARLASGGPRTDALEHLARLANAVDPLAGEVARWARLDSPNHLYAYCFCTIQ
jgi:protease-4